MRNSLVSELYLFGSRARGDHTLDSDFDVFIDSANVTHTRARMIINLLRPYALEHGGRLDLFELHGDDMLPVYDDPDECRIILNKISYGALQADAKPITPIELIQLMRGE